MQKARKAVGDREERIVSWLREERTRRTTHGAQRTATSATAAYANRVVRERFVCRLSRAWCAGSNERKICQVHEVRKGVQESAGECVWGGSVVLAVCVGCV